MNAFQAVRKFALDYSILFFLVWRDPGVSLKGRISRLPEQPFWLYD